jgi:hypothetical protein
VDLLKLTHGGACRRYVGADGAAVELSFQGRRLLAECAEGWHGRWGKLVPNCLGLARLERACGCVAETTEAKRHGVYKLFFV